MKKFAAVAALIVGSMFTGPLSADTTWIIVPIEAEKIPGAFGSLWSTELRVFNSGDSTATLYPPCRTSGGCFLDEVPARSEVELSKWFSGHGGPFFYQVDSSDLARLTFQLRVFDESRTMLNWGTTIPVVEWEKVRGERFWFVRVPAESPFRHTLRIYTFSPHRTTARARYYDADTGELVAERVLLVSTYTAHVQIDSSNIPELEAVSSVRIEVSAESGDDIWAMVSVTNDETQVVTILPGEHRTGD